MTDRLTQLQDAVDQLATQFFSALRYLNDHATKTPDFDAAKAELARDLIVKAKQVELLATSLPGIGVSEAEQVARLRALQERLQAAEAERSRARAARDDAEERLMRVARAMRRV